MSQLKDDENLWTGLVPVAFHVDYWDYIGWKDRFALPVYSERQRRYARRGSTSSVYTPGFVLNGEEWRGWFKRTALDTRAGEAVGKLRIDVLEDGRSIVTFTPVEELSYAVLDLNVAILGFGISSAVGAGENTGRTLTHDFLVLAFGSTVIKKDGQQYLVELPLPERDTSAATVALAAWVSSPDRGRPIQAVGGWWNEAAAQN